VTATAAAGRAEATARAWRPTSTLARARDERLRALLREWSVEDLTALAHLLGRFNHLED
jgi:hypothetical protein